ncbi:MAG: HDIG domain-containing protein [Planctomycetota bacterium]|nr:HDIG domain-containing protein [Planctomycetota bacterium]
MKTVLRLFRTTTARRRELRRKMPRQPGPLGLWFARKEAFWGTLFFGAFVLLAGLIALAADQRQRWAVQQVVPHTIVARVPFAAHDADATQNLQHDAAAREPNVYASNPVFFKQIRDRLKSLVVLASDPSVRFEQIAPETREILQLSPEGLDELREIIVNGKPSDWWTDSTEQLVKDLAGIVILNPERARIERDPTQRAPKIVIQLPSNAEAERFDNVVNSTDDVDAVRDAVTRIVDNIYRKPLRRCIVAQVMRGLERNYDYDEATSRERRQRAQAVAPVEVSYETNQVIAPAGKELTAVDIERLELEKRAYEAKLVKENPFYPALITLSRFVMIALVGLIVWGYIFAYNPRVLRNPMRGMAITGLMLLGLLLAVVVTANNPRWLYLTATWPVLMAAIVLAIAYDRRFAMAVGAMEGLLVSVTLGLPIDFVLVTLVGVGAAVGQLDEVRTRSKLVLTGFWSGVAMALAALATGVATRPLLVPRELLQVLNDAKLALGTGLATGLIVDGALPWIEGLFKVTTAMTLKELNDASHPLLRRLAQEAPGTYQHSLRIADMSEAAADAIGADALLCKVGAMYHDVGKINKPLYFVENQAGGPNRHDKLSPAMSLLIIVGHVKDGVEMAREYGLPTTVRHFIESHHGTTLVEYFYHAARQQRDAQDGPAPSEFEFRYPGPKPQTREAAILMLCDGVEGAARAMAEPSAPRLEALVHTMAQKRLTDGQFDECNLTLQELHRIEAAVAKTLLAMYHGRIAYPKDATEAGTGEARTAEAS